MRLLLYGLLEGGVEAAFSAGSTFTLEAGLEMLALESKTVVP